MKGAMVHSQLETLEEPDSDEQNLDVLEVDCSPAMPEVQRMVVARVRDALAADVRRFLPQDQNSS